MQVELLLQQHQPVMTEALDGSHSCNLTHPAHSRQQADAATRRSNRCLFACYSMLSSQLHCLPRRLLFYWIVCTQRCHCSQNAVIGSQLPGSYTKNILIKIPYKEKSLYQDAELEGSLQNNVGCKRPCEEGQVTCSYKYCLMQVCGTDFSANM